MLLPITFHNITVFTVFADQINAAVVSIRDFIQKHLVKTYQNFLNGKCKKKKR